MSNCPKMISLFGLPKAQSLLLHEELAIYDCNALKSIIIDESKIKEKDIVENDHDKLKLFPELKRLVIDGSPEFEGLISVGSDERQLLDVTASSVPFFELTPFIVSYFPYLVLAWID